MHNLLGTCKNKKTPNIQGGAWKSGPFHFVAYHYVYHTHTENFYNIFTVTWRLKEYLTRTISQRIWILISGSYLWHLDSTRMKPLLSNNLPALCSQTAWWSTFFCATLYTLRYYIIVDYCWRQCRRSTSRCIFSWVKSCSVQGLLTFDVTKDVRTEERHK